MKRRDIHVPYDFFEYVRLEDSVPHAERRFIDVALLDMNHSWPNVGHDSIVHAVLEIAEEHRELLARNGTKVRVLSFDVRRKLMVPAAPNGQFQVYVGTGGPGHLDPRLNDGKTEWSQGIDEDPAWEAKLFGLFDAIAAHPTASLFAICHSFGLVCRWAGIAQPRLRAEKSSGMPRNALSDAALEHPWFAEFAGALEDHRHFSVIDNRLFDLALTSPASSLPLAFEETGSDALTMVELARDDSGAMPRMLGVNHHPEIIDREHIMQVLDEKRAHGEVDDRWYEERASTMRRMLTGESERQSRLTSHYTLTAPLRHQLARLIQERA